MSTKQGQSKRVPAWLRCRSGTPSLQAYGRGCAGDAGTAGEHSALDELVRGCQNGGPIGFSGVTASTAGSETRKQPGQGMPETGQVSLAQDWPQNVN